MRGPLPNYIRTFRRKADLSQDELARLLGVVAGTTVLRHEDYQRLPTLETALRYAAIFRTDPREIFAGSYAEQSQVVAENARLLFKELDSTAENAQKMALLRMLADEDDIFYEPCAEE